MNTTIESKSIYRLVKILDELKVYQLDELQPIIDKIKFQLKLKINKLGVHKMIGKYFKSRLNPEIIFKVIEISESGMIIADSIKIGGKKKIIQFWVGSFHKEKEEWQLVGKKGTYGIQEISEKEWLKNLICE